MAILMGWWPASFGLGVVFFLGFAALRALKNPGVEPGLLRTDRTKVNITSLILAIGRALVGETSLRALLTR